MRKYLITLVVLIFASLIFKSCQKEEIVDFYPTNDTGDKIVQNDSIEIKYRNGETFPIFYPQTASVTYHQKYYQIAHNIDSIERIGFVKVFPVKRTKVLGTLDRNYTNKPAALYDVTVTFNGGSVIRYENHWVKDTINIFEIIPNTELNLLDDVFEFRTERLPDISMRYYDSDYKIFKNKFMYEVVVDTIRYRDYIPANSRGSIYWLNHKM